LLTEAGLNEIRFDLGAVNYNPKVLKNASQYIENVTVEIPAVPEDKEKLFDVLPELCEFGVTNLNLHQLRLTTYNASNLLKNDYTYLHGEQPVVAESEITALEVIDFVIKNRLPIGVNYCNFQFKNRFQKAGFRTKMANVLLAEGEAITENGFVRKMEIEEKGVYRTILIEELKNRNTSVDKIRIAYSGRVLENLNGITSGATYTINDEEYPVFQGLVVSPIYLKGSEITDYIDMMNLNGTILPENPSLFEAWKLEFIEADMRDFF